MTATIPRAELNAVAHRHRVDYNLHSDPTVDWVRAMAEFLRAGGDFGPPVPDDVLAEAADLDALADRCEKPAAKMMSSDLSGANP